MRVDKNKIKVGDLVELHPNLRRLWLGQAVERHHGRLGLVITIDPTADEVSHGGLGIDVLWADGKYDRWTSHESLVKVCEGEETGMSVDFVDRAKDE